MAANPNYQPMFEGKPLGKQTQLTNATPGTSAAPIALWTPDTNDTQRINRLTLTSIDTATGQFNLMLYDGTTYSTILAYTVPIGAGSVIGTPALDLLNLITGPVLIDAAGNKFLELPPSWSIYGYMTAAPTATKYFTVSAMGRTLGVAV